MTGYLKTVCVYCGSSKGSSDVFPLAAAELGELFHSAKWRVINGGGAGLMEVISQHTFGKDHSGHVTGIIPKALLPPNHSFFNVENHEPVLDKDIQDAVKVQDTYGESIIVPDMHTRKTMMARESDAFVALPGGFGTLEEVLECITWSQLNIHTKPIVLFNIGGFYDEFIRFVGTSVEAGFMNEKSKDIFKVANSAQEVLDHINNYAVPDGRFKFSWGKDDARI